MDYLVGGIAGIFEVAVTHPIDLLKNRSQVHNNIKFLPYAGVKPKLISVIPIRMFFWGSTYTLKDNYSPIIVGSIAGFSQTLIETPAEVLKMRQSLKTNQPLWAGFGWHTAKYGLCRLCSSLNSLFCCSIRCFSWLYNNSST